MNTAANVTRCDHRTSLRVEVACEFSTVRAAIAQVRDWLAEKGLPEAELGAWDLALVEAANNAVKYASADARKLPVVIEVSAGERDVEVRVTDHTSGFEWPAEIKLPDADAESGRGLYLMKSLTDEIFYLRHPCQNIMVLRRTHVPLSTQNPLNSQLRQRLVEAETALTDMTSELATNYESLVAVFRYRSELGALRWLKENPVTKNMPVVMLSARGKRFPWSRPERERVERGLS